MRIFIVIFFIITFIYALPGDIPPGGIVPGSLHTPAPYTSDVPGVDYQYREKKERGEVPENKVDFGWGFAYAQCGCDKSQEPCCIQECRHNYCLNRYTISSTVFPPECMPTVNALNECRKQEGIIVNYHHNLDSTQEANGNNQGEVEVVLKDKEPKVKIYEIEVKQGTFLDTQMPTITFTMDDTLKKSFHYKTYDCSKENIKDKEFDTLTISEISTIDSNGIHKKKVLKKIKIPFICQTNYYTLTLDITNYAKITFKKSYRGISEPLNNYEKEHLIYYIYVDEDKGVIKQRLDTKKSYIKSHRENYKLNPATCKYKKVSRDYTYYLKDGYYMKFLKSEDNGWGLDEDSKIYIDIPRLKNKPYFLWGELKKSGYYSKNLSFSYEEFGLEMLQKMGDKAYNESQKFKNSPMRKLLLDMVKIYSPTKEEKCYGTIAFETMIPGPMNNAKLNTEKPKVEAIISIRPSNKAEIEKMKKLMSQREFNLDKVMQKIQGGKQ